MNRVDRLVAIVLHLQAKRLVTARELADYFGISERTVYRDMVALGEAGVPISAAAGEGYSLVAGYHLPPVMFTPREATALALGAQFVLQRTDQSFRRDAESAALKLRSALPVETRAYVEALTDAVDVRTPTVAPGLEGLKPNAFATVHEAIVRRRVLSLVYHRPASDERTCRDVEPLGLIYLQDRWQLVAHCRLRKGIRHFRLDRIERMDPTDERFTLPKGFDLRKHLALEDAARETKEVRLRVGSRLEGEIRDRHAYGLTHTVETAAGIEMTFQVPELEWLVGWIVGYAPEVEVLSPPELVDAMRARARAVLAQYGSD